MRVSELAHDIHSLNLERKYFYSCALIKETIKLWKEEQYFDMLDDIGQTIALHYLTYGEKGD